MNTDLNNKKVALLGLGVEGLASFQFVKAKGAKITILDRRTEIDPAFEKEAKAAGANFVLGEDYLSNLSEFDVIVRSPGIKSMQPELQEAAKAGVVITSQTKLFFDLCPCPIIGVTGTKGKGTTSSLIYEMLKADGRDAYLGGNIGKPPLEFLEKLTEKSMVVLELSSFQLQDVQKSPHIAVMLMVTSEHLDYHATVEEYVDAKRNLLRFQTEKDFAVLNRDYPATNESDILTEGKVFYISRERETKNGCFAQNGNIVINRNGSEEEIVKVSEIKLPGKHNLENVCAATMAAKLAGVDKATIAKVLTTFTGLEHRIQLVAEIAGVKYYDDSFSTTPETAIAAIEAFEKPEILLLGGSTKKSDFSELGRVIREAKNIKAIISLGEEWFMIKEAIGEKALENIVVIEDAQTMEEFVSHAAKLAKSGDIVLLSPACASFDKFKNYKDRGEQFAKVVKTLV